MKKYIGMLIFIVLAFTGCSTVILVRSLWDANGATVDGDEKDWNDRTFYLSDQNLSLGVRNDRENFYLFIKVLDRRQMRFIRAAGLTVWLDPTGDNDKDYGIRIPGKPMRPGEMADGELSVMPSDINEIEIFTKGNKEPLQIPVAQLKEIQFATSRTPESLIFEFKFPLKGNADNPLHWNVTSGEIGVTLETGKLERPNKKEMNTGVDGQQDDNGDRAPMGMDEGGERNGRGRGRGGNRGDYKPGEKKADIDFWFKVRLAEEHGKNGK